MHSPSVESVDYGDRLAERERIKAIRFAIRDAEEKLRRRFPILNWPDLICGVVFSLFTAAFFASSYAYLLGGLPWWACAAINAFSVAVLRELEHDLIHGLYFKGRRQIQNAFMLAIWVLMGNSVNPMFRRKMHFQHHRSPGTDIDFEERLIGNGTKYGVVRILTMLDVGMSLLFRIQELRSIRGFKFLHFVLSFVPVAVLFYVVWLGFLSVHLGNIFSVASGAGGWELVRGPWVDSLNALFVVWVLPNLVRQACLQILSSNMHYHGDVEGIIEETQVLTAWYWFPLQLFTCNFGKTHAIHHFVVNQPFYIRELVSGVALPAMRENGVRFDDLGTFARANRFRRPTQLDGAS